MSNKHDNIRSVRMPEAVVWLQAITIVVMLIETVVFLYSAQQAHSTALLAFGSDSIVELL